MQPKFTLKRWRSCVRLIPALFLLYFLSPGKINAQCTWTASTVYPVPVLDQAVVTLGANLYSFAGVSNGAIVATSNSFNGTVWTSIAPTPQALEFPSAVTDGTNIYILGGASTTGTPQSTLYRYNVATNNYTTLASYTTGTWNQAAVFLNGKIYKFGGTGPGTAATNVLEIYDIATNTWTAGASYPLAMSFISAFAQGNFIYAAGGTGAATTTKAYRYDPVANTWDDAAMADLPVDRWGAASGAYNGGFVMAGGYVGGVISPTVVQWDLTSNAWTTLPNMLGERSRMTGGVMGGNFYVIGGRSIASAGFVGTNNNQRLNCIPLTPCTGTPAPGNTLSTANPVCPTIPFTLSAQNNPPQSGLTYQWQISTTGVGGPFSNIAGATGPTYTTSITTATAYRLNVTCSGNTGTTTPVNIAINPPSACYCIPGITDCTDNDMITRVQLSTLDNSSTCGTGPPPGYTDYTTSVPAPNVISGAPNSITLELPPNWSEQIAVWIDYNKNGAFEAAEFTNIGNKPAGQTSITGNIAIPASATNGITRMRVRVRFATVLGSGESCNAYTFGETEDYNVNIVPCVPIAITGSPASTSITCGGNAAFTVTTTGSIPVYGWEYRVNSSSAWQLVTNGGIYSGATTPTLTLTNVSQAFSGYQYRALVSGGCSAVDFSGTATLTVTSIVPVVSPASATICTGSIQALTLTNVTSAPTTSVFSSGAINIPIPDASVTGINHTIPVSGISGLITDVSVRFSIPAHTWPGDLVVALKGPAGQILNLDYFITSTGAGPGAGMVNTNMSSNGVFKLNTSTSPYTGTFAPDAQTTATVNGPIGPTGYQTPAVATYGGLVNLSNGTTANGNWTIAIYDGFGGDIGSLTNWQVSITYVAPVFAQGIWTGPAGTMWTNAAATVPYTGTPATTIYVNPTVTSNYNVSFTTTTPCTSATTVVPVTVVNPVSAVVNPVNRAVCVNGNTSFTVSAAGGPITYQWQVSTDGGTTWTNIAGATAPTLNLTGVTQTMNNNRYRAVLTAAPCAGSTNSGAAILTVNALPIVTISAPDVSLAPGQTTTITASSTPAAAPNGWTWTLNGSGIPGTTNTQTVNVDGMGTYQARVTDVNGCVSSSNELVITAEASDRLWIYPNPTTGRFQVRLFYDSDVAERRTVTIYNQLGQVITSKYFDLVSNTAPYLQMDFDLTHVPRGVYAVKVAHQFTGKVVSGLVIVE